MNALADEDRRFAVLLGTSPPLTEHPEREITARDEVAKHADSYFDYVDKKITDPLTLGQARSRLRQRICSLVERDAAERNRMIGAAARAWSVDWQRRTALMEAIADASESTFGRNLADRLWTFWYEANFPLLYSPQQPEIALHWILHESGFELSELQMDRFDRTFESYRRNETQLRARARQFIVANKQYLPADWPSIRDDPGVPF